MSRLAEELVESARGHGVQLTGNEGLLTALTQKVLQSALEAEMADHLGRNRYERTGDPAGQAGQGGPEMDRPGRAVNVRNGSYPKRVRTEVGEVTVQVPRDREGSFEPAIVAKRQKRLSGFDEAVISLYAKGMTTGDIANHLAEVYDTEISRGLVSRVTDAVTADLQSWKTRPLERVYPVVLIDAIHLKIREGTVGNRPVYVAVGINLDGFRDVLGMWIGPTGGEGAKQWMNMLSDLRNRGVADVCIVCCDGLKGLPDAIRTTWPDAEVQTCVVHLIRNSLRYTQRRDWKQVAADLKVVYTSPTPEAAVVEFDAFEERWGIKYPALIRLWRNSWEEFVPFLDYQPEVRKLIYTTNGIESLNARFRAAVRRRGSFPDVDAAMKVLFLTIYQREKNRPNPTGRINNWTTILNELTVAYGDRLGPN
ncbi:IS256 family transposase [Nocardioides sp. KC13]|uniref:Mutator family transposase n=1 Tax=Nocardioides turkmenicus TaxID=2711220 RepID=A0A6M1R5A3_9ACTN|nr:IS256 family transposase [Nocardioides sp. KC13]NGN95444.1 IS256 family transposase [Nocardioides sp. KC13]